MNFTWRWGGGFKTVPTQDIVVFYHCMNYTCIKPISFKTNGILTTDCQFCIWKSISKEIRTLSISYQNNIFTLIYIYKQMLVIQKVFRMWLNKLWNKCHPVSLTAQAVMCTALLIGGLLNLQLRLQYSLLKLCSYMQENTSSHQQHEP